MGQRVWGNIGDARPMGHNQAVGGQVNSLFSPPFPSVTPWQSPLMTEWN